MVEMALLFKVAAKGNLQKNELSFLKREGLGTGYPQLTRKLYGDYSESATIIAKTSKEIPISYRILKQ